MATICPTITAESVDEFNRQLEKVKSFAERIHLDFMDGRLTPAKSPQLNEVILARGRLIDVHLMFKRPLEQIEEVVKLSPNLVIVHAEAEGVTEFLTDLDSFGIKRGVALLADTPVSAVQPWLSKLDYVLVFSGKLGYFGGQVDLKLLNKVSELKQLKPQLEIGWDGGINDQNAAELVRAGVDVLNVGGFIHRAEDPATAYAKLEAAIRG